MRSRPAITATSSVVVSMLSSRQMFSSQSYTSASLPFTFLDPCSQELRLLQSASHSIISFVFVAGAECISTLHSSAIMLSQGIDGRRQNAPGSQTGGTDISVQFLVADLL